MAIDTYGKAKNLFGAWIFQNEFGKKCVLAPIRIWWLSVEPHALPFRTFSIFMCFVDTKERDACLDTSVNAYNSYAFQSYPRRNNLKQYLETKIKLTRAKGDGDASRKITYRYSSSIERPSRVCKYFYLYIRFPPILFISSVCWDAWYREKKDKKRY